MPKATNLIYNFPSNPLMSPARSIAIVPTDNANLPEVIRLLYVIEGGTVNLQLTGDDEPHMILIPDNTWVSLEIAQIWETGTSANKMWGYA